MKQTTPHQSSSNNLNVDGNGGIYYLIDDNGIQKLDSSGGMSWKYQIDTQTFVSINSMVANQEGNCYLAGAFAGERRFDPGSGTAYLNEKVTGEAWWFSIDAFVLKIDAEGNFCWVEGFGDINGDDAHRLHINDTGDLLISGRFEGKVDLDPSQEVLNLESSDDDKFPVQTWSKRVSAFLQSNRIFFIRKNFLYTRTPHSMPFI